jgi:hypothetical protein
LKFVSFGNVVSIQELDQHCRWSATKPCSLCFMKNSNLGYAIESIKNIFCVCDI